MCVSVVITRDRLSGAIIKDISSLHPHLKAKVTKVPSLSIILATGFGGMTLKNLASFLAFFICYNISKSNIGIKVYKSIIFYYK